MMTTIPEFRFACFLTGFSNYRTDPFDIYLVNGVIMLFVPIRVSNGELKVFDSELNIAKLSPISEKYRSADGGFLDSEPKNGRTL